MKPQKLKHNYTSELELKSLLIRIKNKRLGIGTPELNTRINKYVIWHTLINAKKYQYPQKRNLIKAKIKAKIIELSERTCSDNKSYERFGEIVLLMIKKILTKPNFSGYSYKDEFYSDAVYKILKYLNNFNHLKISERSGTYVNAFAYISQIMFNSIIYIINTKNKEKDKLDNYTTSQQLTNASPTTNFGWNRADYKARPASKCLITRMFNLKTIKSSLIEDINDLVLDNPNIHGLEITYPETYKPTFDEFNTIKLMKKDNIIVKRVDNA